MAGIIRGIAGISGASAVALGAIGAHALTKKTDKQKEIWKTASHYHLLHSVALLVTPAVASGSRAMMAGGILFSSGMLMFSGGCYMYVLTEDSRFQKVAPFGGTALILGWLALAVL
eukprot:CAMPEP_0117787118 /NCGR_PEP_ID=MMETSP0948-20121206/6214_1 /TAXON_ID=44440 /ORGANISM="Chattonella subsalsa, Strain CCMP2191" /LENGTH=115 /DNA_ID=CAMNT_0005616205 /DNA_START=8 /DNA_END=355 /DNA_ORIENTATION=+